MSNIELLGHLLTWSGFALVAEAALITGLLVLRNDNTDRFTHYALTAELAVGGVLEIAGLVLSAL